MKNLFLRKVFVFYILIISILWLTFSAGCIALGADDEIRVYLNNGDRISGIIVIDEKDYLILKNDLLGNVKIKKTLVKKLDKATKVEIAEPVNKKPNLWKTEIALGFDMSEGNTVKSSYAGDFYANRKTNYNEFTMKGGGSYAETESRMDTQKWYGMIRYAYSFMDRRWYQFYKFESNHDKFANIDYRLIPSTGVGYWFSDKPELKAMTEIAIGLENTHFRGDNPTKYEAVLIPRIFVEKKLLGDTVISQEIIFYPSLSYMGDYRLYLQTSLKNPLTDRLFLRVSFIDNYNSCPANADTDTKRNDMQLVTSLGYTY